MDGFEKDCDSSTKYKDKAMCNIAHVMKLDWNTGTCNITFLKLSDVATGQYKSYNADDEPLDDKGCEVMVTETGLSVGEIAGVIFAVSVIVLVLIVVFIVINRKFKIISHENNNKGGEWVFKNPFSKSAADQQSEQQALNA